MWSWKVFCFVSVLALCGSAVVSASDKLDIEGSIRYGKRVDKLLGETCTPEMNEIFKELVSVPSQNVDIAAYKRMFDSDLVLERIRAARHFSFMDDASRAQLKSLVINQLSDPEKSVRMMALVSLGLFPDAESFEAVVEQYAREKEETERIRFILFFVFIPDRVGPTIEQTERAIKLVENSFEDESERIRFNAIYFLSNLANKRYVDAWRNEALAKAGPKALGLVSQGSDLEREYALKLLSRINFQEGHEKIVEMLISERSKEFETLATIAAGDTHKGAFGELAEKVFQYLKSEVKNSAQLKSHRESAARSLAQVGKQDSHAIVTEVTEAFLDVLRSASFEDKSVALHGLSNMEGYGYMAQEAVLQEYEKVDSKENPL